jgi:putative hemolysin
MNTLYVAAEFSAVSVRRSRLEELARNGNRAARLLTAVIRDPAALDRYVAACQIGITVSSLVLGAYGQATVAAPLAPGCLRRWGSTRPPPSRSLWSAS